MVVHTVDSSLVIDCFEHIQDRFNLGLLLDEMANGLSTHESLILPQQSALVKKSETATCQTYIIFYAENYLCAKCNCAVLR